MGRALLAGAGGFLAAWAIVGDLSESGGSDQIISVPTSPRSLDVILGVVGMVAALWSVWRTRVDRDLRSAPSLIALFIAGGAGLALALRLLSAQTVGANIGGGIVVLALPFAAVVFAGLAVRFWRQSTRLG